MGSFANSIFNLLIGWFTGLVASVWSAISNPGGGSFLRWIGDHWILVAVVVCIVGVAVDVIIYAVRWRPHRVWASFFRRVGGKKDKNADMTETQQIEEQPYYDMQVYNEPDPQYDCPPADESLEDSGVSDACYPQREEIYDTSQYRRPGRYRQSRTQRYYSPASEFTPNGDDNDAVTEDPVRWKIPSQEYEN